MSALGSRLLRSGGAATLSQLVRVGAILATHLVLRRLVPRADWGLRDWVESVFLVLATVRDLGLHSHVLRLAPRPFGNLLAVEAIWGSFLAGTIAVGAPLVALAFHTPRPDVTLVLRAMAIYLVLEGLASVPLTHLEGELQIERALFPEILRTATYCVAALALAASGFGIWSFVLAMIGSQALFCAVLWIRARRSITLHFERGRTLALVGESFPLAGVWLLGLAVTYADALILGARFRDEIVGGYMFAYVWAFFASRVLQPPVQRALYPALVALAGRAEERFDIYRLATKLLLAIEVPAALFVATNAELAARLLGGTAYLDAAPLLRLLAFAPLVDPLGRFGGEYLIANRLDRARVLSLALHLAALVGAGLYLSWRFGPIGMAWANFLPLGAPVILWALLRSSPGGLRRLVVDLGEIYAAPLPLFAIAYWATSGETVLRLIASASAAALSLAWFAYRFGQSYRVFFARSVPGSTILGPEPPPYDF